VCLATEFKNIRQTSGMNQGEFGAIFGFGRTSISDMENKLKEIPSFAISKAVKKFNALGLALEKCQECDCNFFIPARVDIDSSPAELLEVLEEELEEALESVRKTKNLKLYNKKDSTSLTESELRKLDDYTEQLYDIIPGVFKWLEIYSHNYKRDTRKIKSKNITKMYNNGAKRKTPAATGEIQIAY